MHRGNDTLFGSCLLSNCDQIPAMFLVILGEDGRFERNIFTEKEGWSMEKEEA